MKIIPLNNHVIVEVLKIEKSESGILLPTENDARFEKGKVISVHKDCKIVKANDVIYFKLFSLSSVTISNKEFNFIKEEEILGIEK